MSLCHTKHSGADQGARFGRRLALAATALVLALALPVAGAWWTGLPAAAWREFPPRQVYVNHAGFRWTVFALLAAMIAAVVAPVVWQAMRTRRWQRRATLKAPVVSLVAAGADRGLPRPTVAATGGHVGRWPAWGWAALIWTAASWVVAWTRLPALAFLQHHTYFLIWLGYLATINALTQQRTGTCLLTRRPAALVGLMALSAVFWWGFEFLNRSVQNWFYQHIESFTPASYAVLATLSFTTVLPAVLSTHDWLASYPRLTAGLENWLRVRLVRPRLVGEGVAAAGAAGLLLLPVWPNTLFPLLWLAPLALLCGLLAAAGEPTLFDLLGRGDWRLPVRLALAALICGFFWEMWNMYSEARWVYLVPYVGRFRIFEMPVLGYAGYGPFGWECAAVAILFGLWQPPPDQHKEK